MVGPRNFVTPHHCHPPGPCTFEFESLRGIQHIDVGHGHASAPALQATLRLREGEARVESLFADSENPGEGRILGRERDSLEGGAYYISVSGTASRVELEILFEP